MLGILSKEARSATAYTLASVISRGLAIVSMPIFTRIMTPADIGVVNLYTSWYSMISIVSTLALTSGGYSLAMKEFAEKRDAYESSVLALTTIMAFIVGSAFLCWPHGSVADPTRPDVCRPACEPRMGLLDIAPAIRVQVPALVRPFRPIGGFGDGAVGRCCPVC